MKSKSDFWLTLHKLADDLQKEGGDDDKRAANICDVLAGLPPPTRAVYLDNLQSVISSLAAISTKCLNS